MNVLNGRMRIIAGTGLCAGLAAAPALPAQLPTPAAGTQLEEITVTARRREENLQAVPLSITAMSADELQRRSIRDLKDLAQATPGITFFDANPVLATPVIRGLSQTVISAPDRNVGMFYNGVFLSNMNASDFNLFDMERIEVVKGPVSALYGRNAFAGAINYVPKQARVSEGLTGYVEGVAGSESRGGGRVSINVPVGDTFAFRLSAGYDSWDGAFPNSSGGHAGGYEATNVVWDMRWNPTERLSVAQFGFFVDDQREANAQLSFPNNCGQVSGSGTSAANPPRPSFYCGEMIGTKQIAIPKPGYGTRRDGVIAGLNVDYDFGPVTASVIGGFTNLTATYLVDLDLTTDVRGRPYYMYATKNGPLEPGGAQPLGTAYFHSFAGTGPDTTRDMTWELRFASRQDQAFRWMLGASHYKHYMQRTNGVGIDSTGYMGTAFPWSSYTRNFNAFVPVLDVQSLKTIAKNHINDSSPAFYASLGYDVNEKLTLNADVRHDEENRKLTNDLSGVVQRRTDRYETYRFSADYKFDAEKMVYASAAKGVIAGFFNSPTDPFVNNMPVPVELQNYQPSTNWTYEIGAKTSWFDRRLVANLAVFYIKYTDLQITATPPPPLFATLVTNAAEATAKGFEFSLDGRITDAVTAGIGYGYVDPKYSNGTRDLGTVRFCGIGTPPLCTTDVSGNQLTRASQHTLNAYAEYAAPLGGEWDWFARLDGRYQSKQYPRSLSLQYYPGYSLANARVGFSKSRRVNVELWVKNMFDKYYISNAIAQPLTNPSPIQLTGSTDFSPNTMMGEPRSYGVTARYSF